MIPENLQDRNVRRFKGFTPQQVEKLLAGKGFKPNSREAAEYLGAMAERAEEMLQKVKPMKAYQGASVGGFDDSSRKLFDAAVKRSAGTDPKSPEIQRYLDNVIETRGKPTMVFPGTADPLQGYQQGGITNAFKRSETDYDYYNNPTPLDKLAPPPSAFAYTPVPPGEQLAPSFDTRNLAKPLPPGMVVPGMDERGGRLLSETPINPGAQSQRAGVMLQGTPPPVAPAGFRVEQSPRGGFLFVPKGQSLEDFLAGKPGPGQLAPGADALLQPQKRDPLPTTGAPIEQKTQLDTAQANLATAQQELNRLQQLLANTPLNNKTARDAIVKKIEQQEPVITSAQSALASASGQFQTVAVPTAAEAVGSTVTTPQDVITKQPVDLMREEVGQTIDPTTGRLIGRVTPAATVGRTTGTADVTPTGPAQTSIERTADAVKAVQPQERFGQITQDAIVKAQEVATQDLNIRDVQAAQGTGQQIVSPSKRALQQGELVSGAANAEQSAQFLEGIEAATGAPSSAATVQGQLTNLMTQFEGGTPPPWASGAMRQATAIMAQRGMAASSMAGQAIVQAAMESALPIALQDAQTVAQFEAQNLSNRQQRAVLAAQQRATFLGMEFDQEFQSRVQNASRISDIANMNFSSEQQIALENAQLAQTVDLTNLSNRQAMTMAQASTIAQADMANLNNRQQAAVQNAQNFLQMDFRNLDIAQQNDMFKSQSVIQSLFTDASAENASRQFNATSENQTNQFFASLRNNIGQFNATQANAMEQYNTGQVNAMEQFQQEINNQRDQFNAQNALVIAQANAQWRQQLATINNAALNEANRQNALQANGLTQKGLDEIWQKERDLMAYAFATAESAAERKNQLVLNNLKADAAGDTAFSSALGSFGSAIVSGFFQPGNLKFLFGG